MALMHLTDFCVRVVILAEAQPWRRSRGNQLYLSAGSA